MYAYKAKEPVQPGSSKLVKSYSRGIKKACQILVKSCLEGIKYACYDFGHFSLRASRADMKWARFEQACLDPLRQDLIKILASFFDQDLTNFEDPACTGLWLYRPTAESLNGGFG